MNESVRPPRSGSLRPPLPVDRGELEARWPAPLLRLFSTRAFLPILFAVYVVCQGFYLAETLRDPAQAGEFVVKDSRQYYEMAAGFARGDFSFRFVKPRPHRQPLYPLVLAPAAGWFGENPVALGATNVLIGMAIVWVVHAALGLLFLDPVIAGWGALAAATSRFLREEITNRLMTEPLHVLVMVALLWAALLYLRHRRARFLIATAALGALDYLTRTNGLFVLAAFFATAAWADLLASRPRPGVLVVPSIRALARLAPVYLAAVALVVVLTIPSWVPRLHYHRDPLHHGHLTNFLWADSYEEAHDDETRLSWRDYAARHSPADAARRLAGGAVQVFARIPLDLEPTYRRILWTLAVAGAVAALAFGPREFRFLLLFCVLQMLPLAWTRVANPSDRVPYGALLPFEFFFAALALAWIVANLRMRIPVGLRRPRDGAPGGPEEAGGRSA